MLESFLRLCIHVDVIVGCVYSCWCHFAFIVISLVPFLSLCIRVGVSLVSVFFLSMSIQICVPELVSWLALYFHIGLSVWVCAVSFYYKDEYTKQENVHLSEYMLKMMKIHSFYLKYVIVSLCSIMFIASLRK